MNEPILGYKKGSAERVALEKELARQRKEVKKIPLIIGGKEVNTGVQGQVVIPHEHSHVLATYEKAGAKEVEMAVAAALEARKVWSKVSLDDRMAIFLKAADLLSAPHWRAKLNAATMLGQSKNMFQAEIDSACELIDFFRFNVYFAAQLYEQSQPISSPGVWNRLTYRPLEGFVYAVTPFNFTAIGGNLVGTPTTITHGTLFFFDRRRVEKDEWESVPSQPANIHTSFQQDSLHWSICVFNIFFFQLSCFKIFLDPQNFCKKKVGTFSWN